MEFGLFEYFDEPQEWTELEGIQEKRNNGGNELRIDAWFIGWLICKGFRILKLDWFMVL